MGQVQSRWSVSMGLKEDVIDVRWLASAKAGGSTLARWLRLAKGWFGGFVALRETTAHARPQPGQFRVVNCLSVNARD